MNDKEIQPTGTIELYTSSDGTVKLDVRIHEETVWMTQNQMVILFDSSKANISEHIKHIFQEGELEQDSVVRKFRTTAEDGKKYVTSFYNLDVIISVGYRVKSLRGTQFRIWATQRLREYLIKGFVVDSERLKNPPQKGSALPDRFQELLELIRDIRASEQRMYLRILEVYSLADDYQASTPTCHDFFARIQNKIHFGLTGKTAAALITERCDHSLPCCGLSSWKGSPEGRIHAKDVGVAKNYLTQNEIETYNLLTSAWLDAAELRLKMGKPMFMTDWENRLDRFLEDNELPILDHKATVKMTSAQKYASEQLSLFLAKQRILRESEGEYRLIEHLKSEVKTLNDSRKPSQNQGEER